jgi:hypothetical protein
MAAGIAVKAVAGGLWALGTTRDLRDFWASENRNRVNDLSDTYEESPQHRLNHFVEYLTPFCKDMAQRMGCEGNVMLDAEIPANGATWVAYYQGINFFLGKSLVVVNRDMLPSSPVFSKLDPNFKPTEDVLKQHQICQFYIARSLAHLQLNTELKCTILRIVFFVGTVFFLSSALPVASYAIALLIAGEISSQARGYYNKRATQMAIQHSPREAQDAALDRLNSMKTEAASKAAEWKRKQDAAKENDNLTEALQCALPLVEAEKEKAEWESAYNNLAPLIDAARTPQRT